MSFDSLGLSPELLRAVAKQGYTQPTPIQLQAIPLILEGRDLMGGAQTGTGKTASFTLPLLHRLIESSEKKSRPHVRALILTPTRELAMQVSESIRTYGQYTAIKSTVIFGGVKIGPQIAKLRQGVDVLVATPGRLLDHVNQRTVDISRVDFLILDEADRMLDMGFVNDVRKILSFLPEKKQKLLFSATFSTSVKKFADSLLQRPAIIEMAKSNTVPENVDQLTHPVDRSNKQELLNHLIHSQELKQVLVFTRTKHGADRVCDKLKQQGVSSTTIHGNKSQGARAQALANFKRGRVRVLVATDVAARGIDIDTLPHVINFDLPSVAEDYVHRIGRTGRAGNKGVAISLVCVDERKLLRDIEILIAYKLPRVVVEGFEPNPSIKPQPVQPFGNKRRSNKSSPSSGFSRSSNKSSSSPGFSRSSNKSSSSPDFSRSNKKSSSSSGFSRSNNKSSSSPDFSRSNKKSSFSPDFSRGNKKSSPSSGFSKKRSSASPKKKSTQFNKSHKKGSQYKANRPSN